jgi:hypothetical protein
LADGLEGLPGEDAPPVLPPGLPELLWPSATLPDSSSAAKVAADVSFLSSLLLAPAQVQPLAFETVPEFFPT